MNAHRAGYKLFVAKTLLDHERVGFQQPSVRQLIGEHAGVGEEVNGIPYCIHSSAWILGAP